eukprot:CAMPEP_0172712672 /NCGR_PEP_ID=MMETSP1074-20121228/61236_1 /TAXON_ID=2916 /ORGANISM="Ceratium fusus, Strain PA161109" /LENGTH=247 /DNA_ID=CAMNT_0013536631 /DNA_START=100 /DNA_END=843 /DNA_ORIENTATION=-
MPNKALLRLERSKGRLGFGRSRMLALAVLASMTLIFVGSHHAFGFVSGPNSKDGQTGVPSTALESRRSLLVSTGLVATAPALPAQADETYKDNGLGVQFRYPNGLQKSNNKVFNVFFRDIVEPLESLGLKVTPTKRKSLEEIGDAMAVGKKLVADTIPTGAPNEIITAKSKEDALGRRYDIIEFRYQWYFEEELARQLGRQRFQLHQKALIQIYNKKQYLLLVSIEEPRWEIKSDQMLQAIDTWKLI